MFFIVLYLKYTTNETFGQVVFILLISATGPFIGMYDIYENRIPFYYLYYIAGSIISIMVGARFIESYWGDFWMIAGIIAWLFLGYNMYNY